MKKKKAKDKKKRSNFKVEQKKILQFGKYKKHTHRERNRSNKIGNKNLRYKFVPL